MHAEVSRALHIHVHIHAVILLFHILIVVITIVVRVIVKTVFGVIWIITSIVVFHVSGSAGNLTHALHISVPRRFHLHTGIRIHSLLLRVAVWIVWDIVHVCVNHVVIVVAAIMALDISAV